MNDTVKSYALRILADAGCDCYTYGGKYAEKILDDLKEAFPDGMKYGYVEVANAILEISRPEPIYRAPWRVAWDNGDTCDAYYAESFESAKCDSEETLVNWMVEERAKWKSDTPTDEEKEDWDYMIFNCCVSVSKYDPMTDEYEEVWSPTEELDEIGWKPFSE